MRELRTSLIINASPKHVWKVLMNFENYPSWNPFVKWIHGMPTIGHTLWVRLQLPNGFSMTIKPRVLGKTSPQEFRWRGHLIMPGLFDGEHRFELQSSSEGSTVFTQAETFSGILVPLLFPFIQKGTREGFETMNQALKQQCEQSP